MGEAGWDFEVLLGFGGFEFGIFWVWFYSLRILAWQELWSLPSSTLEMDPGLGHRALAEVESPSMTQPCMEKKNPNHKK